MDANLHVEMVNLSRAKDRRAHMANEMAKAGITAQFHPAVDCREISGAELYRHVQEEGPWGYMHPPAAACTLSHVNIWQRFLATGKTHCLILEDDIHISHEFGEWIDDLAWWPSDADIVKLERWRSRTLRVLLQQGAAKHLGRRVARMYTRHVGAAGYVINRNAAKVLLARQPIPMVVDNLLFNLNASHAAQRLRIYQVQPALITQGNEPEGWQMPPPVKYRPEGAMLLRQKIKRGYYEIAYPLSTWLKLISGAAKLELVTYAEQVLSPPAPAHHRTDRTIGAGTAQPQK